MAFPPSPLLRAGCGAWCMIPRRARLVRTHGLKVWEVLIGMRTEEGVSIVHTTIVVATTYPLRHS